MVWRFQTHDVMSGDLLDVVYPASGSWTRRLSGGGSGSHSFKLAGSDLSDAQLRDVFGDYRVMVVLWDFAPVYAGVITRSEYDVATQTLTVSHSGIRGMLAGRLTFPNGGYTSGGLTVTDKSAAGAVRAILQRAMTGAGRSLSLDLSNIPDGSGGLSFEWPAYQVATIDDCLAEVEARGFDIDFVPQLSGDHEFSWAVTVGAPLTGSTVEHVLTSADSPLTGVTVTRDVTEKATSVFVSGNGTGADMAWSYAPRSGTVTGPALERYVQSKRDRGDGLDQVADVALAERSGGTAQWSFSVNLADVSPVQFVPTQVVRVHAVGDVWIPDGVTVLRVVALAGDMSLTVKPEVQP